MSEEYALPQRLRPELAKPMGRLFSADEVRSEEFSSMVRGAEFVVTVGDRVTETFGGLGRAPDVQIVDSRENRKARQPPDVAHSSLVKVRNPAGTFTAEAISGIGRAMAGGKPARVLVDGEEDLLAVPAVVLSPEGARVFYGQPGEGIVMVTVDRASRERNRALLEEIGVPGRLLKAERT